MAEDPRLASVSEAIDPACKVALTRRHWDDLTEECEDRLYALVGSALHYIVGQGADQKSELTEKRLPLIVNGERITGGFDNYLLEGAWLTDHKYTTVWSMIFKNRMNEWTAQANIYAEMVRQYGLPVNKITIEAMFRDWSKRDAARDPAYPQKNWATIPIEVWPSDKVLAYVAERIALLKTALKADVPVECNKEERWDKEFTWAAYKAKNKRATKVFYEEKKKETRADAEKWIVAQAEAAALKVVKAGAGKDSGDAKEKALSAKADKVRQKTLALYHIEDRPGKRVRCADYCIAAQVCPHWKAYLENLYGRDFGPDPDEQTRPPEMEGEPVRKDMFGATLVTAGVRRSRKGGK